MNETLPMTKEEARKIIENLRVPNKSSTFREIRKLIPVDKNASFAESNLKKNMDLFKDYMDLFTIYPDYFLDIIQPKESVFELYLYQRVLLRAFSRYSLNYAVATRAFAKSFLAILALYLKCIFLPGIKVFLCAPGKAQGAKIVMEKIKDIWKFYPYLEKELLPGGNMRDDKVRLNFRNGSVFDVVFAGDSERGKRSNAGGIDEVRDHDGDDLSAIVLPLLNVSRTTMSGRTNPAEPHQAQLYLTSAGRKSTFAYEKLIELMAMSVVNPETTFIWSCDYRLPVMHGLLEQDYVNQIKMSGTYRDAVFAQEYLSLWGGGGEESWFDFDANMRHRVLKYPEWQARTKLKNPHTFYLIGVDVARQRAQSVFTVARVSPRKDKFIVNIVNIYATEGENFDIQSGMLKELISRYNPREVVIDATGVGQGLLDAMMRPTFYKDKSYDGFGTHNVDTWALPEKRKNIIYALTANATLNSTIHSNCYSMLSRGQVRFLITEQRAKINLLSTQYGQKMNSKNRIKALRPYETTSILFEEMANLRSVPTGDDKIKLEPIITRMTKDKFSSFEYLLYRAKAFEDEFYRTRGKTNMDLINAISSTSRRTNREVGRWGRKKR